MTLLTIYVTAERLNLLTRADSIPSGFWYLCDDTDHILLEAVCRFEDKETLVSRIATIVIDDLTIQQMFDKQVYDTEKLSII